jgi:hypothetical protein
MEASGMAVITLIIAAIAALANVIKTLPELGINIRIFGRTQVPLENTPQRHKAWGSILLSLASLVLCAGAFYYFFRPRIVEKIVEKPVDRIVEKVVQTECPKQEPSTSPHSIAKRDSEPPTTTAPPVQPPSTTINAPNGIGISGGNVENPTVNNFAPPEPHITITNNGCRVGTGGFVCSVILKTDRAIEGNLAFTVTFDGDVDSPFVDIGRPSIMTMTDVHSGEPPNAIAFSYTQPNSLPANGEIHVSVNSKVKVKAISVTRGS